MVLWSRLLIVALLALAAGGVRAAPPAIVVLPLTGAIGPATADFVTRGIARAEKEDAQLVVLQIDTPGGLDTSMREIIKAILASQRARRGLRGAERRTRSERRHLHPLCKSHRCDGARHQPRRGDAGADRRARHIAAFAHLPQPASSDKTKKEDEDKPSGDAMTRKQVHDAAAYIRGLAQMRGRNADWAERAVREAVSLSADEALAQHVIDLTARDVAELVAEARRTQDLDRRRRANAATAGAAIVAGRARLEDAASSR